MNRTPLGREREGVASGKQGTWGPLFLRDGCSCYYQIDNGNCLVWPGQP